jgi:hypothetical protein
VQDVDRVADVQGLAQPTRFRRLRIQAQACGLVLLLERVHGVPRHPRSWRYLRQQPAVGPAESQLAIRLSVNAEAFFVHRVVMATTEQSEIRERRRSTVSPVTDVVALSDPNATAREGAPAISMLKRSS